MTPDEIGRILSQAAGRDLPANPAADRAAADRARAALLADLTPVRLLAPDWLYLLVLVLLFAAVAVDVASILGMAGLRALSVPQRALIFSALLATGSLAAAACVRQMRPAAGRNLGPWALAGTASILAAVFAAAFHGYSAENLVHEGIPCLVAGLSVALPTGIAIALLLRRGLVLDWSKAGLAVGVLAGLAGLGMLELHCPNLKAIHVLVWHLAVVVSSAALGWLAGRFNSEV